MSRVREHLLKKIGEGIPFIDVIVHKDGEPLDRYIEGDATGKEKLCMFSCTKPITVTLTMRFIEDGVIGLHDLIEKYIPELTGFYLLDENGEKRPASRKPTVYDLMTMGAGLSYDWKGYGVYEAIEKRGDRPVTVAAMSTLASMPLLSDVGVKMNYSLSHDALGAILEVATGKNLAVLMKEYIFEPLGMKDSYIALENTVDVAKSYSAREDGTIVDGPKSNVYVFADGYASGGAGLVSTVEDYVKFADMLALGGVSKDGVRIISEEGVRALYTPCFGSVTVGGNYSCIQGEGYGYGLGVRTRMKATEWGLPVGEFGWDGAAGSYLMVDPVNRVSVVVGMHVRNWPAVFRGDHLEIVKRVYLDHKLG